MLWFKKKTRQNVPPEGLVQNLCSAQALQIIPTKNGFLIELKYDDYLYPSLKEELSQISNVIANEKIKNTSFRVGLDEGNTVLEFNADNKEATATVDLLEVLKARIPSAKSLNVSLKNVSFGLNNSLWAVKAVAIVGTVLKEHFVDEMQLPIKITVNINNSVSLSYIFKWIKQETMNETVVNSNRYLELTNFLLDHPHPQISKFLFSYRDSSKGMFPEMNLEFAQKLTVEEEYEISEFIRTRLSQKFSHLAIY